MAGDGPFNKKCQAWLQDHFGAASVVLTPSGTSALEMATLLLDLQPGDEVIVPTYTFTSTASAMAIFGVVPVFVDAEPYTLNLDPALIEQAITPKTKAILVMHYAGVGCRMDQIMEIAQRHNLLVIEDAAQAMGALYQGRRLGTFGHVAAFSFHDTKNITCGEGGLLVVNDPALVLRSEIVRDKGSNRRACLRGETDKYTWIDKGSSYLMGEFPAAYLWSQLENLDTITQDRLATWDFYHEALEPLERRGLLIRPKVPADAQHNAHIYPIFLKTPEEALRLKSCLQEAGITATGHYVPLHLSPAGMHFGRQGNASFEVADSFSARLLRLPLYYGMTEAERAHVVETIRAHSISHS